MYRRVFAHASKILVGLGSVQLGAATVALTDKQLSKKPEWYQLDVRALEESIKNLSRYSYIENETTLASAEENLTRYVDSNNPEILWRLARVFAEKSELTKDDKKKAELLRSAMEYAEKAIKYEGKRHISQAHKWLAISASRLAQVDSKAKKCPKLREMIAVHLKRAVELDPNDPFAHHLLGVFYYNEKEYKEAIGCFQKAESIKPEFSGTNLFYLGDAQRLMGQTKEAAETLKKAYNSEIRNHFDGKAKSEAKRILITKLKKKPEEFEVSKDF